MKLVAKLGSESKLAFALLIIPAMGIFGAKGGDGPVFLAMAAMVLSLLWFTRASGNAASSLSLDSQELVAHFRLRAPVRIPLARIAAVEVRRRNWLAREPLMFITIFAKDDPKAIEIRAESWEAEPFLLNVAENAKRLGLKDVAPFTPPRSFYLYDLLPVVLALPACILVRGPFSWPAVASTCAAFVLHSLLTWSRYAVLAKQIETREQGRELEEWTLLIRSS